ncbi:MAG: EF-hand domain-containing protein [Croceibacterium sp.]
MRKFFALTLTLASAALVGSAAAQAQPATPAGVAPEITRDQVQTRAAAAFDRLDRNRDGKLDPADRSANRAERQKALFDRIDTDHNGSVTYAEFAAVRDQRGGARQAGGAVLRRGAMARGPGGRMAMRRGGGQQIGAMADANKDGAITREEFAAAMLQRFDRVDTDHDGKVSPDERRGGMRGLRGPGRG